MLVAAANSANLKEFDMADTIDYEDFPFIPEEYLLKDVVALPAYLCDPKKILGYIVHRRKKMDPNFKWPLPPVDVHEGREYKERFVTREEQKAEQDYAANKKRITNELRLEIEALHKTINNHVLGLRQRCIP